MEELSGVKDSHPLRALGGMERWELTAVQTKDCFPLIVILPPSLTAKRVIDPPIQPLTFACKTHVCMKVQQQQEVIMKVAKNKFIRLSHRGQGFDSHVTPIVNVDRFKEVVILSQIMIFC